MMNCLWLTRQDPRPADSGDLLYSGGLIRSLAAAGAQVTVLCHATAPGFTPGERSVEVNGGSIRWVFSPHDLRHRILSLGSPLPSDAFRLATPEIRLRLRELLDERPWDFVLVDHAAMAWCLDEIGRSTSRLRPVPPVVYVSHNHEARTRRQVADDFRGFPPMKSLLRHDASKYADLERRLCRKATLISAITPSDRNAYRRALGGKPAISLTPGYSGDSSIAPPQLDEETPRTALFLGSFQWVAKKMNLRRFVDAASRVFPQRDIRLQIAGKADLDFVRSVVEPHSWCRFAANVESPAPFLRSARIGILAEGAGGGFKLKALDYLFAGLPMAALSENVRDLSMLPGTEYLAADNVEELVNVIADTIDDLPRLNALRNAALAAHGERYDWSQRGEALFNAMEDVSFAEASAIQSPETAGTTG